MDIEFENIKQFPISISSVSSISELSATSDEMKSGEPVILDSKILGIKKTIVSGAANPMKAAVPGNISLPSVIYYEMGDLSIGIRHCTLCMHYNLLVLMLRAAAYRISVEVPTSNFSDTLALASGLGL
ncbi:unnamed protein product [Dovyalis caffra]|uniref:Uncharacterized protein n=1 Tax=Dovyalis caffra TaxID=77055 RepID=A0AAV1S153_9ROSI|nr:unnamed protein product [Dovyalis caffra]